MLKDKLEMNKIYVYKEDSKKIIIQKVAENLNYSLLVDYNLNIFLYFQDTLITIVRINQDFSNSVMDLVDEITSLDEFTEELLNNKIMEYTDANYKKVICEDKHIRIENSNRGWPIIYLEDDILFDVNSHIKSSFLTGCSTQYELSPNKNIEIIPIKDSIDSKVFDGTPYNKDAYVHFKKIVISNNFSVLELLSKDHANWEGRAEHWSMSFSPIIREGYFSKVPVYKIASNWDESWNNPTSKNIETWHKPHISTLEEFIGDVGLIVSNDFVSHVDITKTEVVYYCDYHTLFIYDAKIKMKEKE